MKVKFVPQDLEFEIKPGQSVMHVAQDHGLYIKSVCKGVPSCAECRVRVTEGDFNVLPPGSDELSLIGSGYFIDRRRLSCQLKCFGDITVDLSEQLRKQSELSQAGKKLPVNDRVEQAVAIRATEFTSEETDENASLPVSSTPAREVRPLSRPEVSANVAPRANESSISQSENQPTRPRTRSENRPNGPSDPRGDNRGEARSDNRAQNSAQNRNQHQAPSFEQNRPSNRAENRSYGRPSTSRPTSGSTGGPTGGSTSGSTSGPENLGAIHTGSQSGMDASSGRRKRRRRGGKGPGGGGGGGGPSSAPS